MGRVRRCESRGSIKCVVVGDAGVGKSCLASKFATGKCPATYIPTTFDNYAVSVQGVQSSHVLSIFDTSGQEVYSRLRNLSFMGCDVFVVCFSVISTKSFKSIEAEWISEISKHCNRIPFVLVGTHADLRDSVKHSGKTVISVEMGRQLAQRLGAWCYTECSGQKDDPQGVFQSAVEAALANPRTNQESDCSRCQCTLL